jgi:hypothetical protein
VTDAIVRSAGHLVEVDEDPPAALLLPQLIVT